MLKNTVVFLLIILQISFAQYYSTLNSDIYRIRLGVDVPINGSLCIPSIPSDLMDKYKFDSESGLWFNSGLGVSLDIYRILMLKVGYQYWGKKWILTYPITNGTDSINVKEDGRFHYTGMYFEISKEIDNMFLGAGIDLGFTKYYKYDLTFSNSSNHAYFQGLETGDVNNQIDINIFAGCTFELLKQLMLRPNLIFGIPCKALFESGEYKFNIFTLRLGISFQYYFIN